MLKNTTKTIILKVIVGSQAHGLATPESDFDYRGVFVVPTREILSLGNTKMNTNWNEGKEDDTSWELGHFLNLATHCNPTILETFLAPMVKNLDKKTQEIEYWDTNYGIELRNLFPYVWNSIDVKNAFIGYGLNQRKKFLEDKDKRAPKYAAAYLRTLYNAYELLNTGTFTVKIADTEIGETVRRFKNGEYTIGEVIQICTDWKEKVDFAFDHNPEHKAEPKPVNDFLLKARKKFWDA